MGILDRFKGKKEEKTPEKEKSKTVQAEKTPKKEDKKVLNKAAKPVKKPDLKRKKTAAKEENFAWQHLLAPLVTEKSTFLMQQNKYVFKVHPQANKYQIKDAIEQYYGVVVTKLNIIKIHPKKRIQGRTIGFKKGFKKAIVTLQTGDTISTTEGV